MKTLLTHRLPIAAALAASLLAGCGGSGDSIERVRVLGDSIYDAGTFGITFTIQGPNSQIMPGLIAQAYGFSNPCNYFSINLGTGASSTNGGCNSFAVGGSVINGAGRNLSAVDPRNLSVQLAAAKATRPPSGHDLYVVDGGGNDAADLAGAYLKASSDGGVAYTTMLGTLLTPAQVSAAVAGGSAGLAAAGNTYMNKLADRFADMLVNDLANPGASHVLVMNMPVITYTPRFRAVLAGVSAAAGSAAAAQTQGLIGGWVASFNTQLQSRLGVDQRFVIVDMATAMTNWTNAPAASGYTNVTQAACPAVGVGGDGLPTYDFPTCTESALAANPPAGATGGSTWYTTWLYSDGFHPTPTAHAKLSEQAKTQLRDRKWL